jgi:2-polyprenyl-3-methyl-5-hydroxy-6-metoxy-1,4-benzoquinol methylase
MTRKQKTKEKQYACLLDVKHTVGVARLGLMVNQVWHDDPRRLGFVLARYKFVAKMLSGRGKVGEVGCGDAFASRIVLQEVKELHVYDFDPIFIADVTRRQVGRWQLHPHVHDILDGPLREAPFDALYSIDVMEHIPPAKEDIYLDNLKRSLAPHGVIMVGMPSLESQAHASPPSKAGHVNCKNGNALKSVLEKHFHNVFLFSMNDELVHTGFTPLAHYLFALCCEAKP